MPDTFNSSVQQFNLIYDKLMMEDLDLEVLPLANHTMPFWESSRPCTDTEMKYHCEQSIVVVLSQQSSI